MTIFYWILMGISGISFCSSDLYYQEDSMVYKHPDHDIEIRSSLNWDSVYDQEITGKYELVNTNHNMHISMWYSETGQKVKPYLRRIVNMQGYIFKEGPRDTILSDLPAMYLEADFLYEMVPYRVFIAAIRYESGIYLLELKCPEDCYRIHGEEMRKVLSSLKVGH